MMRKLRAPLLILLLAASLVTGILIHGAYIPSAPGTLVKLAEMPPYCAEEILYHDYWKDFLQYCDGYEILLFRTKDNLTDRLDSWTHTSSLSLEEAESLAPLELYTRTLHEARPDLPASYTAFFLTSTFEKGELPWYYDEFTLGLYDAKNRLCLLYRGHHLYGLR